MRWKNVIPFLILSICPIVPRAMEPTMLEEHCIDCHDDSTAKADFRIDTLLDGLDFGRDFLKWEDVLMHLVDRSMPPRNKKRRPSNTEYEEAIAWLRENLTDAELVRAEKKTKWMRRLNRSEYNNTIRDLFGMEGLQLAENFPLDDALHGFDNVAEGLNLSPLHVENYLKAAYQILDKAIVQGTQPKVRQTRYRRTKFGAEKGDQPIKGNSANMWFERYWIGGPFFIQHRFKNPGTYRFTIRATPRQFDGSIAGFITTINGRNPRYLDIFPRDHQPAVLLEFEAELQEPGMARMEIRWTENQNSLGEKRPNQAEKQSPFRQLQAMKKKFPEAPDQKIIAELGWPVFENLEVNVSGPHHESWPPPSTQRLLKPAEGKEGTAAILATFLPRAFRRNVSDAEVEHYVKIAEAEIAAGEPWIEALKHSLAAALVSPHFLFLMETPPTDATKGGYQLNDFELASRLSYFLWSSMPDSTLFDLARKGRLTDPAVLKSQVDRMLADPKAGALTDGFAEQWLSTRRIPALMPEPSLFGRRFNHYIQRDMAREPLVFFDLVRRENRPITDFLDSDYAMLNGTMARHYGIDGVTGQTFRKVALPDANRGGLLTQAGYLTLTSEATRTSPVKRGIWNTFFIDRRHRRRPT